MNRNMAIAMILVLLALAGGAALLLPGSGKEDSRTTSSQAGSENMNMGEMPSSAPSQTPASSSAAATTKIEIEDYNFTPATIRIKVGDTVTWTNKDTVRHDVMSDTNSSDAPSSQLLAKGQSYSFKFTKAGTYSYHCSPHPYMKGTVIVE